MIGRMQFAALLLVALAGCVRPSRVELEALAAERTEAAAIYAIVVREADGPPGMTWFLSSEGLPFVPITDEAWNSGWFDRYKRPPQDLVTQLAAMTAAPYVVDTVPFPYSSRVLSEDRARRRPLPNRGYAKLSVSRIAMRADGSEALVYCEVRCGPLCGGGIALWLTRDENYAWRVHERIQHWVS